MCLVISVVSNSGRPHGPEPASLLCPWDSPSKNTSVGCHALVQGIFAIQGSNPGLLHCTCIFFYHLIHQGSPLYIHTCTSITYTYTHIYSAPTHNEVETSSPRPLWRKRERAYLLLQSQSKSFLGGRRELSLFQNVSIWHQEE